MITEPNTTTPIGKGYRPLADLEPHVRNQHLSAQLGVLTQLSLKTLCDMHECADNAHERQTIEEAGINLAYEVSRVIG